MISFLINLICSKIIWLFLKYFVNNKNYYLQNIKLFFRVKSKLKKAKISVTQNGETLVEKFCPAILPGSMQEIELPKCGTGELKIFVEGEKE